MVYVTILTTAAIGKLSTFTSSAAVLVGAVGIVFDGLATVLSGCLISGGGGGGKGEFGITFEVLASCAPFE